VLGFSLQTIILDVFTGLAIHFDRPFSIGDWIRMYGEMDGMNAKVLEINWRTTRLLTETNELVIVPNSILGKMIFTNYNQPDQSTRLEVSVRLDSAVPFERCRHVLLAAAKGTEGIMDEPSPVVLLDEMNEVGAKYLVRFWIKPWTPLSPTTASSLVLANVAQNLQFAGIGQAIPKLINFDSRTAPSYVDSGQQLNRVSILRKISLFQSLNDEEFDILAESASSQSFIQGDTLIRQGDAGDSMYVLVDGLLDVYRTGEGNTETRVARIQTGRFFGEMSLLTGEPRSATIRAALNSVVLTIEKSALLKLLEHRPGLVDDLSRSLAERRLADKARELTSTNSLQEQSDSLTDQFKKKILGFFRVVFDGGSRLQA
ncbi:MAG: mechanosensitive ion channel family protein, partial [Schlesneria sp.]